jgi:hypothetical protein
VDFCKLGTLDVVVEALFGIRKDFFQQLRFFRREHLEFIGLAEFEHEGPTASIPFPLPKAANRVPRANRFA